MFVLTPKEIEAEILHAIPRKLVPYIVASPGVGKSALVQSVAKKYRLKLIDIRLSSCQPEDLQGFPMRNGDKASFTPFDLFPLESDPIPEGYDGWLMFFDEFSSTSKGTQAASYKVMHDKMVGSYKLHPNVAMVCAGNKASDRAIVTQISTALASRVIHYEMQPEIGQWTEIAYNLGFDHRIISFLNYMPSRLMKFNPDKVDTTFPCPRTWEFLSRLIQDEAVSEKQGPRVAAAIGSGTAHEFITFVKEFDRLPKIADILADPENAPIPHEKPTRYATMGMLVEHTLDSGELPKILKYIGRFPTEMQILYCRGISATRQDLLRTSPEALEFSRKMVRHIAA